jgi:hypothetical protein
MARASEQEQKGSTGASEVTGKFTRIGWGFAEITRHDNGIDLFLMARDERLFDLGRTLGAQVKAGPSYFSEPKRGDRDHIEGWWFRDDDAQHLTDMAEHGLPQLLVLYDLEDQIAYWVHVTSDAVQSTGKGAKIFVPRTNTVDEEHRQALLEIAATTRPQPEWQGSVWNGAPTLGARDMLRHALIVPRLVGPHRNAGLGSITAVQGIAMLMQARIANLNTIAKQQESVPSIEEAKSSADWTWRLFGALGHRLVTGEVDVLQAAAADAPNIPARVAATVAAVSGLMEEDRPDEAIVLLQQALERDDAGPIDHAWLTVQFARSLAEVGKLQQARDAAVRVQGLRRLHPEDLTAAAIEGIAAQLLFRITDFGSGDLEQAIRGADTAVAWWRQQAGARGLGAVLERSFQNWARDTTARWSASDVANDQLLAAALTANLAGDHGDWRYLSSLLGHDQLLRTSRSDDPDVVKAGLSTLRLAGAEESVKLAAIRLVRDGPALGVRSAAAAMRLGSSTSTTAQANLDLLRYAGSVLDQDTANAAVQWILNTLAGPSEFIARTTPSFEVATRLLDTLAEVLVGASTEGHSAVIQYILDLPPVVNQAWATSLAVVVRRLDPTAWTAETAARASDRSDGDDEALKYPLLSVAIVHRSDIRQQLLGAIRAGSAEALHAFGDVRDLSSTMAAELISSLVTGLRQEISDAHKGHFNFGGPDLGDTVTLLNLWHPGQADWSSLLDFLADTLVVGDHKVNTIRRLAQQADQIPNDERAAVADVVAELVRLPPPDRARFMGTSRDVTGPAALLQAALGTDSQTFARVTLDLVSASSERRSWAARLAGHRAQPEDIGLLASLICDLEPEVRSAAAAALTKIMAAGHGNDLAEAAFRYALQDPGLLVPLVIARTLTMANKPNSFMDSVKLELGSHPLQPVRDALRRNPS